MKAQIQITVEDLEEIIRKHKNAKRGDSSLSDTVTITLVTPTDRHLGSDAISVRAKSGYQDADGYLIFYSK